jgi:hypothetical protein
VKPPASIYVQSIELSTIAYLIITRITALAVVLYLIRYSFGLYWGLKNVPSPLFAKFTDLQRVWWVKTGRAREIHRGMHAMYGPVVRFGPNIVSVSDPRAIPTIYPSRPGFPKVSNCSIRFIAPTHDSISFADTYIFRVTFITRRSHTHETRAPCLRFSTPKMRSCTNNFEAR